MEILFRLDELNKAHNFASSDTKRTSIRAFEHKMKLHKHKVCICCHAVRLKVELNRKGICTSCKKYKNINHYLNSRSLPIWYQDCALNTAPQYHLPNELKALTVAEKLLIQQVSVFVPLEHIKKGTFGLKGHVCAFSQDVNSLVKVLPRKADDVDFIRVQQFIRTEIGSEVFHKKAFKVFLQTCPSSPDLV